MEMLRSSTRRTTNRRYAGVGWQVVPASLEQGYCPRRVDFRSWLSYDQMIDTLYRSRIGVIIPHPIERYLTNYPVKLFEYMAAGLPIVIAARDGESSKFVSAEAGPAYWLTRWEAGGGECRYSHLMTNRTAAVAHGRAGTKTDF